MAADFNVIKTDNRNVLRNASADLVQGSNNADCNIILGNYSSRPFFQLLKFIYYLKTKFFFEFSIVSEKTIPRFILPDSALGAAV